MTLGQLDRVIVRPLLASLWGERSKPTVEGEPPLTQDCPRTSAVARSTTRFLNGAIPPALEVALPGRLQVLSEVLSSSALPAPLAEAKLLSRAFSARPRGFEPLTFGSVVLAGWARFAQERAISSG